MCGVTGYIDLLRQTSAEELSRVVRLMSQALQHRGPDDEGVWVDEALGVALGFRRLAILDLSLQGHQPMLSADQRYVIGFNGEIYNFKTLRQELESEGQQFRGHSDTEVLLAAISQWGVEATVPRLNGMFAFALLDRKQRRFYLVRDPLGEKPLYYGWMANSFLFGSELKPLRVHPDFRGDVDRDALLLYFRHNYVPSPYCIYKGLNKLPPATLLTVDLAEQTRVAALSSYWSARTTALAGIANPFDGSAEEAAEHLEALLSKSVGMRMVADVPLGAFLSGGVDSSTVVALMQSQSSSPIRTFSIGFNAAGYNEAEHALAVARHLGTSHTDLYVTPEQAMEVIPRLPTLYDEPFADSSQIPTFLVSKLARQYVTVSLSGDGADEVFGGYNRYSWTPRIWHRVQWLSKPWRHYLAKALQGLSPSDWEFVFSWITSQCAGVRQDKPGDKMQKVADILKADSPQSMYLALVSQWQEPGALVPGASEPSTAVGDLTIAKEVPDFALRMMYLDTVTYLPDDILVKLDRATMAVGLEARVPFLDRQVLEFAWRLPLSMKVQNGRGKWLLRQVLRRHVPDVLTDRPKMGFALPVHDWLRGPLRDWAESLLDEHRLKSQLNLQPRPIRARWQEHLSGKRNWQDSLWGVLMFQAWHDSLRT